MAVTSFRIPPRPPVRALAIAALCALSGAMLLVIAESNRLPLWILAAGVVLLLLGVLLSGSALIAMRSRVVTLTLTDDGYQLDGAGRHQAGRWATVTRVTSNASGNRITIEEGERKAVLLFSGQNKETSDAVAYAIAQKLLAANP